MPGIIMGALGGMGEAAGRIGSDIMRSELKKDEMAQESASALSRAQSLETFKNTLAMNTADKLRTEQVGRIESASGAIADKAVGAKRGIVEGAIADREAWTPEQQAAVDQSLEMDRSAIASDPKTRTQAAISTGDIDPKTAATFGQKDDALLYKTLYEQSKEDGRNARADAANESREKTTEARIEAQNRNSDARLEVMLKRIEKSGSGGGNPTKEALNFIDGARKEVASEAANLKALYQTELKGARFPEDRAKVEAEYKPKFAEVEKRRDQIQEDFNNMRERVGLPKAGGAAPAAPPKPAAASPAAPAASRPPLSNFMKN